MATAKVQNWKRSITSYPAAVVRPDSVDDIVAVVKDKARYPSPVRAIGSNHSTTRCGVADGGTVIEMTGMSRVLSIDSPPAERADGRYSVTAEAGALYIDVAKELQRHGLQFYVNVELGNLSIGSAACGGTKDASMPGEFGQVASYALALKLVLPSGELLEVTEADGELLQVMRSSYGLLGIVYEATFRVKPLSPMSVDHVTYSLDAFTEKLPELIARDESMMYFLLPFQNKIIVEYRRYSGDRGYDKNHWLWKLRNFVWKTFAPGYGFLVTKLVPIKPIRYFLIDRFNRMLQIVIDWLLYSRNTIPTDQIIRYPKRSGWSAYTFSIWAFREEGFPRILRDYYAFVKGYYKANGYRCNMVNVGYRINEDLSSLFSYSSDGTVMTLDPVSTGDRGWNGFLCAYNEFCSQRGGVPLFNQTRDITPLQARQAFGARLVKFADYQRRYDPGGRFLNEYFGRMLDRQTVSPGPPTSNAE